MGIQRSGIKERWHTTWTIWPSRLWGPNWWKGVGCGFFQPAITHCHQNPHLAIKFLVAGASGRFGNFLWRITLVGLRLDRIFLSLMERQHDQGTAETNISAFELPCLLGCAKSPTTILPLVQPWWQPQASVVLTQTFDYSKQSPNDFFDVKSAEGSLSLVAVEWELAVRAWLTTGISGRDMPPERLPRPLLLVIPKTEKNNAVLFILTSVACASCTSSEAVLLLIVLGQKPTTVLYIICAWSE
jgi:hypothetical protein